MNLNEAKKIIAKRDAFTALQLGIVDSDPFYPVRLGDAEYKVEFRYGAVARIFKKCGIVINMTQLGPEHYGDPAVFEALLYEGLRTHHRDVLNSLDEAEESVTDLVPMRHLSYVIACIGEAIRATEPDPLAVAEIMEGINREFSDQQELPLTEGATSVDSGQGASVVEFPPAK